MADSKSKANETCVKDKPVKPVAKKSKKKLILILSIIGGVIVLLGVGFAIWWFAIYNNSDSKVLSDAYYNTLTDIEGDGEAKISVAFEGVNAEANIKTSYSKGALSLDIGGKFSSGSTSISAGAGLVVDDSGNIYLKVNDLENILSGIGLSSSVLGGLDLSKVSDKWVTITQTELESLLAQVSTDTDESTGCIERAIGNLTEKKSTQKELLDAITDSKILTAERVGSDKDGIKFKLTGDFKGAREFAKTLLNSEIYKAISNCTNNLDEDTSLPTVADLDNFDFDEALSQLDKLREQLSVEVYFWVGKGHQPTRLSVNVKISEPEVSINIDVTRKVGKTKVTAPKDSTTLTSLIQELQGSSTGETINYDDYSDYYQYL